MTKLRQEGAVVLTAQPGAGKTTRVPPAMLEAGLANLPNKTSGQIVVLQPRRVAARAAAARISEERGTELGAEIGYQVRHESRASKQTRILVCTEGVFIRRLQNDPLLEDVAAVVFDEFHERSLDSDLALAMVRQVRKEVRPDLRILVMSATLDTAPVAEYLGQCPTVESEGRTYPIAIEYLPFPPNGPIDRLAVDGIKAMLSRTQGHLLVFLPGVGEIRQTERLLSESLGSDETLTIMPLYGDLPLDEQQRVLRPSRGRKVVLATNVAETSITIDGVTAVIDSGLARVNRIDPQLGLNRLGLARIAKSSAKQRAGRAGRTAPGLCLRLWTEKEQHMMAEFDMPEIARVELSECVLQLIAWGESDVRAFPFFEAPPAAATDRALELLERLDALDGGALTELGRRMAHLPLQPRLARLLLEGQRFGHVERAAVAAALLAERDPFRRSGPPTQAQHHSDSDVLDRVSALEDFDRKQWHHSVVGELQAGAAKRILRSSEQLIRLTKEAGAANNQRQPPLIASADEALLRALLVAFPDRVCRRREAKGRRGVMVGGRGVRLADDSAVAEGELFAAIEFVDSASQSELLVRQASLVQRSWLPESQITSSVDVTYDAGREKVIAMKRTRFCDLVIDEIPTACPPSIDPGHLLAETLRGQQFDLTTLVDEQSQRYLARIQCLREWLPELELPDFGPDPWTDLLPQWCIGCSSLAELRTTSVITAIQSRLTSQQLADIEKEAPDKILVPSGRLVALDYNPGAAPILAVRVQELFGMRQTPRLARSRVSLLLHLLAPNYRVQQITPDLASFWTNTYPQVKKELKRRYPKHSWPDDPLTAQPERGPRRRQPS